jgi:hypothetical protein
MAYEWSVSFELATVRRGVAATREQAEKDMAVAYAMLVPADGNEDKLAWFVEEVR